jgi:UDP-N-acetylmuramate dehydrogenase
MQKPQLIKELKTLVDKKNVRLNEPMSLHTTFQVGGPADIFVTPANPSMLVKVLTLLNENKVPFTIVGNGSNLVVSDKGIRGVVICTNAMKLMLKKPRAITVNCGMEIATLAEFAARQGFSGLEFACGIPGTIGGAVYMNAGAYEGEMSHIVSCSKVFNLETNLVTTLTNEEHEFGYRQSVFQKGQYILLNTTLKFTHKPVYLIKAKMEELTQSREAKQPLELPSAGSVFRRPQGHYTGHLIEKCSLKGFRIGDAAVSDKHCGFIVNLGKATAADIKAVIAHVQKTVLANCGVALQTEIRFIGEE